MVATAALLLATHFSSTDKLSENWYEALEDDVDASEVHGKINAVSEREGYSNSVCIELASEMLEYYMEHYLVKSSHSSSQNNSPYPHHTYRP